MNGTQTWLTTEESHDITLEWRLHPVASFRGPQGVSHYDLWDLVVGASADPAPLGGELRRVESLWDGLECFPAYGEEIEPAPLAAAATATLGIPPDASGLVDHDELGERWERTRGGISLVDALLEALGR